MDNQPKSTGEVISVEHHREIVDKLARGLTDEIGFLKHVAEKYGADIEQERVLYRLIKGK